MMQRGCLLLVLSLCNLLALAGDNGTITSVWLGVSGTAFRYEEFNDQCYSLDREDGWLPGVKAGLSLEEVRWFVESSLWWSAGNVDFTSPRHDTKTKEEIQNVEILAGTWLYESDRQRAGLVFGAGYRRWHRDIHSTETASGLDETYRWTYGVVGLRGLQVVNKDIQLVANIQVTRTIDPEVNVDFADRFDDTSLELQEKTGFRASLELYKRIDNSTTLWVTPWYEYWEFGRSANMDLFMDGKVVGTVFEPRSETHNAGITFGVTWQFGGT